MEPTPGQPLADIAEMLSDPAFVMVARLAKGPAGWQDKAIALGDFVEADFPGYAPIPIVMNLDTATDHPGFGAMGSQRLTWEAGNVVTPQTITHVYYTKTYNGADNSLVCQVPFDNPIVVSFAGQPIEFDATVLGFDGTPP